MCPAGLIEDLQTIAGSLADDISASQGPFASLNARSEHPDGPADDFFDHKGSGSHERHHLHRVGPIREL
jgi:hypothetical protein